MVIRLNPLPFSFFILFIIYSCGSTQSSGPHPDEVAGKSALKNLDDTIDQGEDQLSGIGQQDDGAVTEIIDEVDRAQREEYRTGEPGWITVSRTEGFSWRIPRPKARENMLKSLRNEAVSKKVGTTVEITSLLTDLMSATNDEGYEQSAWSGFFKSTVSGVITDQKIEKDELNDLGSDKGYELQLTCRFYVVPVQGDRDPGFILDARLDKNMLNDGDELVINVKPSKDCHIYMFNLMADNNALLMYPNDHMKNNYVEKGNSITVPDPDIRKYVRFRVGTMPGEEITSESIYVVCTKQPIPMIEDLPKVGRSLETFRGDSDSFVKLQRWLTKIPLDQRIEKALIYHVSKK